MNFSFSRLLAWVALFAASAGPALLGASTPAAAIRVRAAANGGAEILTGGSQWQPAAAGERLPDDGVVRAVIPGAKPEVVVEREGESSGELLYVGTEGVMTRIGKALGALGRQPPPPPVVRQSQQFWDRLLKAKSDILAEKLLAQDSSDPTFRQIQGIYPRLAKAEACIGRKEDASGITVAIDGSVSMGSPYFSGSRRLGDQVYSPFLRFRLNGRRVARGEYETAICRGLLNGWLPATQTIYRQGDTGAGWEELVLTGLYRGRPGLFIRFRIGNLADAARTVSLAMEGPEPGGWIESGGGRLIVVTPLRIGERFDCPWVKRLQEAAIRRLPQTMHIPVSASLAPTVEDRHAAWTLRLGAGQTQDIYLFMPGGDRNGPSSTVIAGDSIAAAFYVALRGEYEVWNRFLASGARISLPEPGMEDVFDATLIQTLVSVNGDEPRGGFTYYQGYWPFCTLHQIRLMLDTSHPDYARRYLAEFMKNRIRDDGRFWFDVAQEQYQVSDAGDFLSVLSLYYWQTGDASVITGFQGPIGRVLDLIRRERESSMARFPRSNPRWGMIAGSVENDVPSPDYLYTNNAPVWAGLRDYAAALGDLAKAGGGPGLAREAAGLAAYAAAFHRDLRASFERCAEELDAQGRPYYFNLAPNDDGKASRYLTNPYLDDYRRFQCQPRAMATDFLTDGEILGFYRYQSDHDATILGVRRWRPDILDDFVSFDCDFQRARLGLSREYLMKFFAYLQCLSGNGTWTAFEEADVAPADGHLGRGCHRFTDFDFLNGFDGQHATCAIPKLAKDIFAVDRPGGGSVCLAGAVSLNWLATGRPVLARDLGSRYGPIDFAMRYDPRTRATTVKITAAPGRTIPEVRVRLRDPAGGEPVSVDRAGVRLLRREGWAVLRNLSGSVCFTAAFSR